MNTVYASLAVLSFTFFPNGDMVGTTTNGIPFSQTTVMEAPRVQEFKIGPVHWYVCEGGAIESLKDLLVCFSNNS